MAEVNFSNLDSHVKELVERFNRLIKQLGPNNKAGTERHKLEVDFAYAIKEVKEAPPYLQGKMFDEASGVVNTLINSVKSKGGDE